MNYCTLEKSILSTYSSLTSRTLSPFLSPLSSAGLHGATWLIFKFWLLWSICREKPKFLPSNRFIWHSLGVGCTSGSVQMVNQD